MTSQKFFCNIIFSEKVFIVQLTKLKEGKMGVRGYLNWIKRKYPRVIRETHPTFENYDMLFVDIPAYVSLIFRSTAKPYSNVSILMSNILSDIDRLVQFSQPSKVIFFSFESVNGLLPYAKAFLKRYRKITLSKKEAKRLARQLNEKEGYVSSGAEEENDDFLADELAPGDDAELEEAFKEFSKLGEENNKAVDNSTIIQKVKEMVDKINKKRVKKAKKAKKQKEKKQKKEEEGEEQKQEKPQEEEQENEDEDQEIEEVELNENEMPQLMSIDEFLKTVKRADYDKEIVPDIKEFLIEFVIEFMSFIITKLKSDHLYQNKRIIVSDSFVQGEAEHKIMDFLRNETHKPYWDPNTKVCICSMDNDLINLSMQTCIRNMTIVNCVNNTLSALLIDIKVLRDSIGIELNASENELPTRIDDIVMISLLISNDFTPKFPDLPSCSMDQLFELYKSIIAEKKDFALFRDGKFDVENIKFFLNKLIKKAIAPEPNLAKAYLMNFEDLFPNPPIEEMSRSYFETIAWTMYLYKYGMPSNSHYYKYEYAPPLSTAIEYIDAINKSIDDYQDNFQPLSKSVLYVLSGGVVKGTDPKLAQMLKSPESPVAYMFAKRSDPVSQKKKAKNADEEKKMEGKNNKTKNDNNEDEIEKVVDDNNDENNENDNESIKVLDIDLVINTVKQYENELKISPQVVNRVLYNTSYSYGKRTGVVKEKINLKPDKKHPFVYISKGINDSVFEPEFWPVMDELTLEQANSMVNKMIFYSRPYKVPAIVKEVLKYDDVPQNEKTAAFLQVSIADPLFIALKQDKKPKNKKGRKKNKRERRKENKKKAREAAQNKQKHQNQAEPIENETNEQKEELNENEQKEELNENEQKEELNENEQKEELNENDQVDYDDSSDDDNDNDDGAGKEEEKKNDDDEKELKYKQIKEKLIFFRVTPLPHYHNKEKDVEDVIVYAPYVLPIDNPEEVLSYIKMPQKDDKVITKDGNYGTVSSINKDDNTALVICNTTKKDIDKQIREVVSHDSENYLTEEEFAQQVGIAPEAIPLIASRLILLPDNSNISIKFYTTLYNKLMCGYCIQNEKHEFLFSKAAVPIAKKYLNQPVIFKQLIEQSAMQIDKRLEHELEKEIEKNKNSNKSKKKGKKKKEKKREPKIKMVQVGDDNNELADEVLHENNNEEQTNEAETDAKTNNDEHTIETSNNEHTTVTETETDNDNDKHVITETDSDNDENIVIVTDSDNDENIVIVTDSDNDEDIVIETDSDNDEDAVTETDNDEPATEVDNVDQITTDPETDEQHPPDKSNNEDIITDHDTNNENDGNKNSTQKRNKTKKQQQGQNQEEGRGKNEGKDPVENDSNHPNEGANSNNNRRRGGRGGRGRGGHNAAHSNQEGERNSNQQNESSNSNNNNNRGRGGRGRGRGGHNDAHSNQEGERNPNQQNESGNSNNNNRGRGGRGRGRGGRNTAHSNQEGQRNSNKQNQGANSNNNNRGGKSKNNNRGRGDGKARSGPKIDPRVAKKRKLYLNDTDTEFEEVVFDNNENIQIPSNEETENDPPFTINVPTSIRATVIDRLDNFFKHYKSVNASIFDPFNSTSLSIESIHKINEILCSFQNGIFDTRQVTCPLDQLTCQNEYTGKRSSTFKAGDRVVLRQSIGYAAFGKYGTIICANDSRHKAVICLDMTLRPSHSITFTNYKMKNNFSDDRVVEVPYFVLQLVNPF